MKAQDGLNKIMNEEIKNIRDGLAQEFNAPDMEYRLTKDGVHVFAPNGFSSVRYLIDLEGKSCEVVDTQAPMYSHL